MSDTIGRLMAAVGALGSELSLPVLLRRVVETATEMVDARYGALGVLDEQRSGLSEFVTVGLADDSIAAIGDLPRGHGILGLLILEPEPLRLPDLTRHPDSYGFPPNHPEMTTFLGAPIRARGEVFGNLYLTEKRGGGEFTKEDEDLTVALAAVAGVAIENARLHDRLADLALVQDRERIARDLHDTVIQRLFATGMTLSAVAGQMTDEHLAERLQAAVDDLDDTVRRIRTTIFELQRPGGAEGSLRRDLLELAAEAGEVAGVSVGTRFDGPIDNAVDPSLAEHVLAAAREALSNAARHSAAGRIDLNVAVTDGDLLLEVGDDGSGFDPGGGSPGSGLANLAQRAEQLGGAVTVRSAPGEGCSLSWRVPAAR